MGLSDDYPMGARVRYTARGEVGPMTTGPLTAVGLVNGDAFEADGSVYVPVWSEREGREATTILVNAENIIAVEAPS